MNKLKKETMKITIGFLLNLIFGLSLVLSQTIEVENMAVKSAGYPVSGAWVLDENGFVADTLYFDQTGYFQFKITAKGTNGDNDWPHLELNIDNYVSGPVFVNSSTYAEYTTYSYVSSGSHVLYLRYINDSGNRAVTLDRVKIAATQLSDEEWLTRLADIILTRFPDPASYNIRSWVFEELMWGVAKAYEKTGDVRYLNYVKAHIDDHVYDNGNLDIEINDTIPGILIVWLYQQTHEQRFLLAAQKIGEYILTEYPRTSDGGFVHFARLIDQLWDDTMGGLGRLLGSLGQVTGDNRYFDEGVLQFRVHAAHLQDLSNGLFYHAYDEDRSADWSDPVTGHSPEFWARGNGWIIRGLADFLEYLPPDHPGYAEMVQIFRNLVQGLIQYQEAQSGLWFTVVDKGERNDNYLETSGSLLIAYGIYKGLNLGVLPENYRQAAEMVNQGLFRKVYERNGQEIFVTGVSEATGPGDYQNYVSKSVGTGEDYPYGDGIFLQEKNEVVRSGQATTYSISGNVNYFSNQTPIPRVTLSLISSDNQFFETGLDGFFAFQNLAQGINCQIIPEKLPDSDVSPYEITAYDAALTAQAAVGLRTFSENESIAADVTKDNQISTYDAALIARYAVGLPKLLDSHAGEWDFVPDVLEYQNLSATFTNQNFTGILLGNVYGDWQPARANMKRLAKIVRLEGLETTSSSLIDFSVPFYGSGDEISLDLEIKYDERKLIFKNIKKIDIADEAQIIWNNENGTLRVGVYQITPFNDVHDLFALRFMVVGDKGETKISMTKYLLDESTLLSGICNVKINDENVAIKSYRLAQSYPNPFMLKGHGLSFAKIEYMLPEPGKVELFIYNSMGQLVRRLVDKNLDRGEHSVHWDGRNEAGEMVSGGVYFYQLKCNDFKAMKKLLILK